MEIAIIILLCTVVFFLVLLYLRERKKRKVCEKDYQSLHIIMKDTAAQNIDMKNKLKALDKSIKKQDEMSQEIKALHEKSRLLKHDMKNHMLVLLSYIQNGEVLKASEYIGAITDKLNRMYSYIYTGNALMNYILNQKLSAAAELGIDIKAEVEALSFDYMESIDFSSLLGNLLDNAVEATSHTEKPKIEVHIFCENGFDVIQIKNSIDTSVLNENPQLQTTKQAEGHGYGIKQIKNIAEKYNGDIDIYEENGIFAVNVICPHEGHL